MTPEQERAEARKALESATPGPWEVEPTSQHLRLVKSQTEPAWMYVASQVCGDENAHLIANAPIWLRNSLDREEQLIAENERKDEEINTLKLAANDWEDEYMKLKREFEELDKSALETIILLNESGALKAEQDKELQRLRKVEEDYKALQQIMDRARRLAFLAAEDEEPGPRFKMDANGNLTRTEES